MTTLALCRTNGYEEDQNPIDVLANIALLEPQCLPLARRLRASSGVSGGGRPEGEGEGGMAIAAHIRDTAGHLPLYV